MNALNPTYKFKALAKMGYLARGAVYIVIGGLAVLAAIGAGGETTDSKGAIQEILEQPFGTTLIILLVIGLFGFMLWRLIQALVDTDEHGTSVKGLVIRGGLLVSAATHALLGLWAIKLMLGDEQGSENKQQFLSTDGGQLVLGVVGLAFAGAGLATIYKGAKASFERYMKIPAEHRTWARPLCRFGLISRGIVWCILAWFCIDSALTAKSGEIKGIADALNALHQGPHGTWLFAVVAAGVFAFGVYSVLEAFYRRIEVDKGIHQLKGKIGSAVASTPLRSTTFR